MEQVTVLVSVFNKASTVKSCIESLLNLDYANKKIFVVEGFSKDSSCDILKAFAANIELRRVPGNYSMALNWAIEHIDTPLVAMTDADCIVAKNWLTELVRPFVSEDDIVATAGFCTMPDTGSKFQKMVNIELEKRFRNLPKYLKRAPTMNICLKTEVVKKLRFDESQQVAVEVDFCYRLIRFGKIRYVPEAIVYHYHRNTLLSYFKQQKDQVKWACRVLLKHRVKFIGDPLNPFSMLIQIPLMVTVFLFFILSIFNKMLLLPAYVLSLLLIIIYLFQIKTLRVPFHQYLMWLGFFIFRTFAWITGIIDAVFYGFKKTFYF